MKHTLQAVLLAAVIAAVSCAAAAQKPAETPKTQQLNKTQLLAVEAISRRQADLTNDSNALMTEFCSAAKIEVSVCEFDPSGRSMRVKAPVAKASEPAPSPQKK